MQIAHIKPYNHDLDEVACNSTDNKLLGINYLIPPLQLKLPAYGVVCIHTFLNKPKCTCTLASNLLERRYYVQYVNKSTEI